jgi:hypothetical protein
MRNYGPGSTRYLRNTLHQDESTGARRTVPFYQRAVPPDATAIIYRPARSAMTSGKANTRRWKLRFEPRAAPFIEPLMGWTGGTDTMSQVELDFPSAEAAVAYARRQGLNFVLQDVAGVPRARPPTYGKFKPGDHPQSADRCNTHKLEWVERTLVPHSPPQDAVIRAASSSWLDKVMGRALKWRRRIDGRGRLPTAPPGRQP